MKANKESEIYWQFNKTVVECNRYMFENSIGADVTFRIKHAATREYKQHTERC